jgi:hypothetical protein
LASLNIYVVVTLALPPAASRNAVLGWVARSTRGSSGCLQARIRNTLQKDQTSCPAPNGQGRNAGKDAGITEYCAKLLFIASSTRRADYAFRPGSLTLAPKSDNHARRGGTRTCSTGSAAPSASSPPPRLLAPSICDMISCRASCRTCKG